MDSAKRISKLEELGNSAFCQEKGTLMSNIDTACYKYVVEYHTLWVWGMDNREHQKKVDWNAVINGLMKK